MKGPDGRIGLLVSDYGGASRQISVNVKGLPKDAKATCTLLDYQHDLTPHDVYRHDLTPHDVSFANGKLKLVKPDFHSAAFFVEFSK